MNFTRTPSSRSLSSLRFVLTVSTGLTALLAFVCLPAHIAAQPEYPSSPYGSYSNPYPQTAPQYGYGQPQYAAPQPYTQQPYAPQPDTEQSYAASPYDQQPDLAPENAAPAQPLSAEQLEQLLAPIALYPDSLLAQILAASTYPAQVAVADQWLHQMQSQGYNSADQIAAGANAQTSWDPSIKALTAFPDVLDTLDQNLSWTTDLGNAYYNQPQDVMQTVQVLRQRAQQAGNLQTTPQEQVTDDQGYIGLNPPDPQQVYVPTYNPWDVYGQPISPYPGFSFLGALGDFFGSSPIQYALSFGLGAFDRFPFGFLSWGLDWLGQAVLFNHDGYYTHSYSVADWGFPHGGPRAYGGWRGSDRWHGGYDRAWSDRRGDYQRGGWDRGNDQRGNYGRSPDQRGFDQRGNNQRGDWAGNRNFGQSNLRPSIGVPYSPRPNGFSNGGANGFNRGSGNFNRGFQSGPGGFNRPSMPAREAYNNPGSYLRSVPQGNYGYRSQQNSGSSGYGFGNRSSNSYSGSYSARPGFAYTNPGPTYRAPQSFSPPRGFSSSSPRGFSNPSPGGFGNSMVRNQQHSGGFHLFGHGSQSRGFSGGSAPKNSFGGFGGGHSSHSFGGFGGGHSSHSFGGFGGGGHSSHSFGGGGHSFGGGGHSSHSFGGGHSSSHSGGGHHR